MSELMVTIEKLMTLTREVIAKAGIETFVGVLIVTVITFILGSRERAETKIKVLGRSPGVSFCELRDYKLEPSYTSDDEQKKFFIDDRLNTLSSVISQLYPGKDFRISIKMIQNSGQDTLGKKEVTTWRMLSSNQEPFFSTAIDIETNPIYSKLYHNKHSYFFVTDFEEYAKLVEFNYPLEEKKHWHNTMIVYPIEIENKFKRNTVGFLCISSAKRFNNIRKNEILKTAINIILDQISEMLPQNIAQSQK